MISKSVKIWASIGIFSATLFLSSWAISSPVGSSPDSDFHNSSVWCGQGIREGICELGSEPGTVAVPSKLITNSACFAFQPERSADCTSSDSLATTSRVNLFDASYPPIYYWSMSWFASADNIDQAILSIRVFNAALAVAVFSMLIVIVPRHLRRIPVISVLASSIPLGFFLMASVNPSGWAYVSVLVVFVAALSFFSVRNTRSRLLAGILGSLSFVAGAGSREDTGAYLLFAALLAWFITRSGAGNNRWRLLVGIALTLGAVLFAIEAVSSNSFIGYFLRGANWGSAGTSLGSTFKNLVTLPDLWVGAFGSWGLGWLDTPLPSSVWAVTFGIFASLVFATMLHFGRRQAIATGLVAIALVAVPIYTLAVNGLLVGQIVQPRYLLPLIGLLIATAVYRTSNSTGLTLSRGQVWLVGIGLFAANAISLHTNLRRYLTGLDQNQVSLNYEIEWWWVSRPSIDSIFWFSPNYVWLVGSLAFGLMLISLWKLREVLGLPGDSTRNLDFGTTSQHDDLRSKDIKTQKPEPAPDSIEENQVN